MGPRACEKGHEIVARRICWILYRDGLFGFGNSFKKMLELIGERRALLIFQNIDTEKLECELFYIDAVEYPPEFQELERVSNAAVPDMRYMGLEVCLQPFLVAAVLVKVAVGICGISITARHNVDVGVGAFGFLLSTEEPDGGRFFLNHIFFGKLLGNIFIKILQRGAGGCFVVGKVTHQVKVVGLLDHRSFGFGSAVEDFGSGELGLDKSFDRIALSAEVFHLLAVVIDSLGIEDIVQI